jgi:hypothetical protein
MAGAIAPAIGVLLAGFPRGSSFPAAGSSLSRVRRVPLTFRQEARRAGRSPLPGTPEPGRLVSRGNTINGKGGTGFIQKRGNANDTIVNAANYTKALR